MLYILHGLTLYYLCIIILIHHQLSTPESYWAISLRSSCNENLSTGFLGLQSLNLFFTKKKTYYLYFEIPIKILHDYKIKQCSPSESFSSGEVKNISFHLYNKFFNE